MSRMSVHSDPIEKGGGGGKTEKEGRRRRRQKPLANETDRFYGSRSVFQERKPQVHLDIYTFFSTLLSRGFVSPSPANLLS